MTTQTCSSVRTLKALEIDNVKINEAQGYNLTNITRGKLEICYSKDYDRFILRANSFKYVLSPNIRIIAFLDPNAFRCYLLPKVNGYYLIKLKTAQPSPVIQNFETILTYYCRFSYQIGQAVELDLQAKGKGEYPKNVGSPINTKTTTTGNKSGSAVSFGGEFIKQKIIKAADYIGKGLGTKTVHVNAKEIKSILDLKTGNYAENEMIELTRKEFDEMINLSRQIENDAMYRDPTSIQTAQQGEVVKNAGIIKTTTDSAKSVLQGMDEAVSILTNAIFKKKNKPLAQNPNEPNLIVGERNTYNPHNQPIVVVEERNTYYPRNQPDIIVGERNTYNPHNQPNIVIGERNTYNPLNQPTITIGERNTYNPHNQPNIVIGERNTYNPLNQPNISIEQRNTYNPNNQAMIVVEERNTYYPRNSPQTLDVNLERNTYYPQKQSGTLDINVIERNTYNQPQTNTYGNEVKRNQEQYGYSQQHQSGMSQQGHFHQQSSHVQVYEQSSNVVRNTSHGTVQEQTRIREERGGQPSLSIGGTHIMDYTSRG